MKTAMTAESTLYDAQTIRERVRAAGVVRKPEAQAFLLT